MNIYVGNLSCETTTEDINRLFERHGNVSSAKLISDRDTNRSKGFGFVVMSDNADAYTAIEALNKKEFKGRSLRVNKAKNRPSYN